MVPIDIITYALCKKLAAGAVSGVSGMRVEGTNLIITTNDGQELVMNFPIPEGKEGISIVDVEVDANGKLLCTLSNGNIIDAGKIPPVPVASKTTLGGVKVGKNLTIDEDGTLNAIGGGSGTGTSDYNDIENKPTINGVEVSGDKTAADYGIEGDKTYTYTQPFETKSWSIQHNLNKYPSVMVVDKNLCQIWGDVQYLDLNTVRITFTENFTGQAFLN